MAPFSTRQIAGSPSQPSRDVPLNKGLNDSAAAGETISAERRMWRNMATLRLIWVFFSITRASAGRRPFGMQSAGLVTDRRFNLIDPEESRV
jgi:hypothetical protein